MLFQFGFVIFYLTVTTYGSNEGDRCIQDGVAGTCFNIKKCPSAIQDIRNRKNPQICTFDGSDPVVCCVESPAPSPVVTSPPTKNQSTTATSGEQCEPIPVSLTTTKTGQKAWDKCIEYQEQLVYPCQKTAALNGELVRSHNCVHNAEELILQNSVYKGQFPHMMLLGFGNDSASAQWLCAGTLLSDRFILTAGHCSNSRDYGPVTYAVLGAWKRSDNLDTSKVYKIRRIIKHPDYQPPNKYNDLALLETEIQMKLDKFAVPACLDVGKETTYERAIAIGWETVPYIGNTDDLQMVHLEKFSEEECSQTFPVSRRMKKGVDTKTQICYGDHHKSKDACQSNGGGPLQVKNKHVNCMYTVIGVMSLGKQCSINAPNLYTRVEAYVPWIENIVWP